jgi:hypothetical protein
MIEILGYTNIILLAIISYIIASKLLKSVLDRIILAFLFLWTDLILTALLLSLFRKLACYPAYFVLSLLLLSIVLFIVKKVVPFPINFQHDNGMRYVLTLKYYLIFILVGCLFVLNLITVITYPPNNGDSITYHLPRIYRYLSQGHLGHFVTINPRQIFFPFNATLLQLPVALYGLSDRFFSFINLIVWTVISLNLYRISYFIVRNSYAALLSVFFGLTGTAVLAQATTSNNDIILAMPILSAIYFLFLWVRYRYTLLLLFSMLSAGIAIGTKVTVAFFIPGAIIYIVYILMNKKLRPNINGYLSKLNWKLIFVSIILMLMLALPSYYVNYRDSGHFSDPEHNGYINSRFYHNSGTQNLLGITAQMALNPLSLTCYDVFSVYEPFRSVALKRAFAVHVNRFLNKFWIQKYWNKKLTAINNGYWTENLISMRSVEDEVWYGIGTYLLLFALLIVWIKKNKLKVEFSCIKFLLCQSLFFYLTYGILMKWQPWSSRFFVPAFLLLMPVIAVLYNYFQQMCILQKLINILICIFVFIVFFDSIAYVFMNMRRPLNITRFYNSLTAFKSDEIAEHKSICVRPIL